MRSPYSEEISSREIGGILRLPPIEELNSLLTKNGTIGHHGLSCGILPIGRNGSSCPVYSTQKQNRGDPTKASGTLAYKQYIYVNLNNLAIASPATAPEMLVGVCYAQNKFRKRTEHHCSISPRSIPGYRIYFHREARLGYMRINTILSLRNVPTILERE